MNLWNDSPVFDLRDQYQGSARGGSICCHIHVLFLLLRKEEEKLVGQALDPGQERKIL